jgi:hypothetical protein
MNKGILKANGEYLLFLNSGDYIVNNDLLYNFYHNYFNNKYDIIYGNQIVIDKYNNISYFKPSSTLNILLFYSIPHASSFIKKQCLINNCLYDENLNIVSDWKFFLEAFFIKFYRFKYIDLDISYFESGGISSNKDFQKIQIEERNSTIKNTIPNIFDHFENLKTDWDISQYYKKSKKVKLLQIFNILKKF